MSVGDLWHGIASCKSHVSELKNWMPSHSKKSSVGVELRAGGDPHKSEKPGWSAGDMSQWSKIKRKQKMHRHPISPAGVLLLVFLTCSCSK